MLNVAFLNGSLLNDSTRPTDRSIFSFLMFLMILNLSCGAGGPSGDSSGNLSAAQWSPSGETEVSGRYSKSIDRIVAKYVKNKKQPGLVVLLAYKGKVQHARGYGLADLKRETPIKANTRFRLASVSKPITAIGILKLMEAGKLILDDPVTRYVPGKAFEGVTIRHLLTHTSGLADYEDLFYDKWNEDDGYAENRDLPPLFEKEKPRRRFKPGEKYAYCNTNYALLALVAEKASGRAFHDFMRREIFEPAGMHDALVYSFKRPAAMERRALGYKTKGGGFKPDEEDILNGFAGDGGIYATVYDLLALDQALRKNKLLSEKTQASAYTPHKPKKGKAEYGLGWEVDFADDGTRIVSHSGSWVGFRTLWVRHMDRDGYMVAVLSNNAELEEDLADIESAIEGLVFRE